MIKIQPAERVKPIRFSSDGYRLAGVLHLPENENPPVVIGVHGLLSNRESAKQRALAQLCTTAGMAYFRFDHRGCGGSQGILSEVTTLDARVRDLQSAVSCIRACMHGGLRIGLFGSSMGGAVCLSAARSIGADALVTYAAPLRSRFIRNTGNGGRDKTVSSILRKPFDISGQISGLRHILIFHGDADEVVPYSDAVDIFDNAAEPKRLVRQSGGDHPMSHELHQTEFARDTVGWFGAYLNP
jgi:alpha-beta hydrolase superfamily lysophospholipase